MIIVLAASLQAQWSTDPNNILIVGYGLNPDLCSDSAGGCYITYEYGTTGYPRKLGLERLDKYGYKPWGTLKQIPGELPEQWHAEIIEDGEGGVIISYLDDLIAGSDFIYRVRVQRVDSASNLLWGQTGVRVTTEELNHGVQRLVSDGNGGCIIVWSNELQDFTFDYRANRINNLGERVWGDMGIFLENSTDSQPASIIRASDGSYYVQISTNLYRINQNGDIIRQDSVTLGYPVPDTEGGVVLSGRVGSINNRKLVAQRQDSLGNNLWQEPYVEIADSIGLGSFRIGVNNRVINYAWLGRYDSRPYFHAINLDGNIIYPNKILLSEDTSGTTLIGIISSYYNNTIYSWSISGATNSIYAQMYDTLGNKIWSENGVTIAHPRLTYQQYITDGRGGFIVAGLINNFTVVAQQVSINGYLGEIVTSVPQEDQEVFPTEYLLEQNFPNPFNSSTIIKYQIPKVEPHRDASLQMVKLTVYDVLGNEVATLVDEEKPAGTYEVDFNSHSGEGRNLTSGIYFYKLEAGNFIQTKKMMLLK